MTVTTLTLPFMTRRGGRLKVDEDESDNAAFGYVPGTSGNHTLRVGMYACTPEPCGYGVGVYVRD